MITKRKIHLIRSSVIDFIAARNTGVVGEYQYSITGQPSLYSSCYALMTLHYLQALPTDDSFRNEWASYILNWQDESSGAFIGPELSASTKNGAKHDREHLLLHLTTTVIPCLDILGVSPRFPLRFAHKFLNQHELASWLGERDWSDAWLEGNNLIFVLQLLVYFRDTEGRPEAQERLEELFAWLNNQVDHDTGLWGTDGACSTFVAMCGGYHQLLAYYSENVAINEPERLVDVTMELQHHDGGFHPGGGGGACEDVDAVDILVNMYKFNDYRRPEIRVCVRTAVESLMSKHMDDGGFVYRINEPFSHMGMELSRTPKNCSNMFATWFRIHTLALAAEILVTDPISSFKWDFNPRLSMGWHTAKPAPKFGFFHGALDEIRNAGKKAWLKSYLPSNVIKLVSRLT